MGWNNLSIPKLQQLHRWSLGMDKLFHPTLYWACHYISMLVLKLVHVSKRGLRSTVFNYLRCLGVAIGWKMKMRSRNIANKFIIRDVDILNWLAAIKYLRHGYVWWWRHQMKTFSASLALCAGIHRSPVNSPHKGQWRGALLFSFTCARING